VWKSGQTWKGIKTHMGYNQEAYDAECAALARALEEASRRNLTPEQVTIFADAQAAISRMVSDKPGPGQQYALQARKHIATLRRARPGITIEIRWCPAHKGIAGNEKADEWAKRAAEEPDTHGVEWLSYNYDGRSEVRAVPLPRSLANLKREISEKKWVEARQWAGGRTAKAKYKMPESQKPDGMVAGSTKKLASRVYQLKTGHCRTGQYLHWAKARPTAQCWWCQCPAQTRDHLFKVCPKWKVQQKILWAEVLKETKRWKSRWTVRDLLADERRAGSAGLPLRYGCGKASAATGGKRRRRKRGVGMGAPGAPGAARGVGGRGGGAGCRGRAGRRGGRPLFLPTPPFMVPAGED